MAKAADKDEAAEKNLEKEILAAVEGFEKILEAMPEDRPSLEALAHAYEQMGQKEKAKDYLLRLGEVLVEEGDVAAARDLVERILPHAEEDAFARELLGRIQSLTAERISGPTPVQVSTEFNMAEELSFAWNLLQATLITQEEYASLVQDLTEMCAGETIATVSVLHVMEARTFRNLAQIIAWAARECGTPFIPLSSFELQNQAVSCLPMDFMLRRGALVFEFLGNDALAVVMNPFDQSLRKDVEALTGRACHFFLTMPSEFDQAIDKVTDVMAEPAPSAES
jgi:tetratricopeptide (TPR) repeat protein